MGYEQLCNQIFDIDKQIRYVGIFSKSAEIIAGGMRQGVKTLTPEPITQVSIQQSLLRWQTRTQMEEWIGAPKYAVAEYEKIKRFTFYLDKEKILLVSTELGIKTDFLIDEILKILPDYNS